MFWKRFASYKERETNGERGKGSGLRNIRWKERANYLWQLLSNVSSHKHSLQVDPEILHHQPVLNYLC